eukprot:3130518-Rhodomonas_salina.2
MIQPNTRSELGLLVLSLRPELQCSGEFTRSIMLSRGHGKNGNGCPGSGKAYVSTGHGIGGWPGPLVSTLAKLLHRNFLEGLRLAGPDCQAGNTRTRFRSEGKSEDHDVEQRKLTSCWR